LRWTALFLVLLTTGLGCRAIDPAPELAIGQSAVHGQLVLKSDFPLPEQHRLIDELVEQRTVVAETLDLPPSHEPIHVFLFRSPETFQQYFAQHYPDFPLRRAFFVETDTRLAVYAHWGDRVAEDLRHEVAHGYMHAAVRDIPLWLDEGLAEYFEVPRGHGGLNRPHLEMLLREIRQNDWSPSFQQLESITDPAAMTQLHYAEAWAWSHLLLETTSERRLILHSYFQRLRDEGASTPLSLRLRQIEVEADATLREHLLALGESVGSAE